jgi:hypothetical protein
MTLRTVSDICYEGNKTINEIQKEISFCLGDTAQGPVNICVVGWLRTFSQSQEENK